MPTANIKRNSRENYNRRNVRQSLSIFFTGPEDGQVGALQTRYNRVRNLLFFILIFIVKAALGFEGQSSLPWEKLEFTKTEVTAEFPAEFKNEIKNLSRNMNGKESDFFAFVA